MCCRKIDEDDNDAGIESQEDVKIRRPCDRYDACLVVTCIAVIAVVAGVSIGLGYLFMQPAGPPCTLELYPNRTDGLCTYEYDNTVATRVVYRTRSSTPSRRVWVCPELCLFNVDGQTTINDCDENCESDPGWITAVALISILLCASCCIACCAYNECDCKEDDKT